MRCSVVRVRATVGDACAQLFLMGSDVSTAVEVWFIVVWDSDLGTVLELSSSTSGHGEQ